MNKKPHLWIKIIRGCNLIPRVGLYCWISAALVMVAHGPCPAELVDRIAVVVNDDIILLSDLQKALIPVVVTLKRQGYSQSEQIRILAEQRKRIREQLIYDKLTEQQVARYGIEVGDDELDATIERIREANQMSKENLLRALEMDGLTYDDYRRQIKEKLLQNKLVNLQVKSKIVITDADIEAYYDAHISQYASQNKYRLRHILIKVSPEAGQVEKMRIHQHVQNIYQRLKDGESFAKLAGLYSNAPTAADGGSLGVFEAKMLSENIRNAIEGLESGQYSNVLDTDQGYQIFYVDEIIIKGGKTLEEVKQQIQEKLYAEDVENKFNTWIEALRQRSHIQIIE